MAEKSRSLSFFLFVCALLSGVIFYGCGGGGGTSSQHVPLQISGNVTSMLPLAGLRADSALSPDLRSAASLAGVEVYLESAREMHSTRTDSEGRFLLSGVPAGNHYLIARVLTATGTTLKVRSSEAVAVSDTRPTAMISAPLALVTATASASGKLLDVNNQPVRNGSLMLWGETFYTDSNGMYTTPPMPFNTIASVVVTVPGFQQTAIPVKFTDNPPFIEQTIVNNSATNRPPTSALTANRYTVSPGVSVLLAATASDPDETLGSNNYAWSTTIGTFSGSLAGLSASWIAPSESTPATVTFTVTDSGGLISRSNVGIVVGTGIFVPNNPPTIASLTSSSTDGKHYSTLTYALTASATDIDGNNLTYTWTATSSANAGTLSGSGKTVNWQTPTVTAPTNVTVTVSVTDGKDSRSLSRTFSVTVDPYIEGNSPPNAVTISLPTPGELFVPGEQINVAGSATDYDPATSQYVAMEASAFTWELIYPNNTVTNMAAGRSEFLYTLPRDAGNYTIRLTATDKYQAKASSTRQLRINSAPALPVIAMNQTNPIRIGTVITFTGSATDVEDGSIAPASLTWKFPAPINTWYGNSLATNTIPEGTHIVELSARDSKGAISATATRQVIVSNTGPTMTIATPAEGAAVVASLPFAISGSGVDVNNAAVDASTMVWELWRSGVATYTIASQTAAFNYTFDEVGHYVLTLTGKDAATPIKTGTTQRMFTVNATPSVSITWPASGTRFDLNTEITFDANLSDSPGEEAFLIASWSSSIDDDIGVGAPLKYSDLSSGSHVITCEVINTRSKLSTSTSTMILVNTLPVGTLTYDIATYADGPDGRPIFLSTNSSMNIPMTMTTYDADTNAEVAPENIKWFFIENNIEVPFATGKTVTTQLFPLGLASITVRIYDSFAEDFEDQASATYKTGFQVWQSRLLGVGANIGNMTYLHTTTGKAYLAGYNGGNSVVNAYEFRDGLNPFLELAQDYILATTTPTLYDYLSVDAAVTDKDSKIIALGTQAGGDHYLIHDVASATARPYVLPSNTLNGATSLAMHPSDLTIGYLAVGGNKLLKFSPASKLLEETITSADGTTFNGLSRVRSIAGGTLVGKVFAADRVNDRVVRYLDYSLGSPVITSASAPVDVAVSGNYLLVLENSGKVSVHLIDSTGKSNFVMRFGGTVAGGAFTNIEGISCSGKDLFILEAGASNRVHLIRSGMTNWLSD
ncbi:MAG: hypothetical protein CVV41_02325 [Candidatus Riflebacteria bacterium HGW-Riflebacteria-1]|jgi:hypothetical protein|nr:MAG: hypothetical protein CVV41_02325 [Candidatus Riflebacteria bacterium HGW-Riflebacteria-1]